MVFACVGVVLAQQPERKTSDTGRSTAQGEVRPEGRPIAGQYIVVLEKGEDPSEVADAHRRDQGAGVRAVYDKVLGGYSARMSEAAATAIANDPRVAYVEPDQQMTELAQADLWGMKKIRANLSSAKAGDGSADLDGDGNPDDLGLDAYIIDTGVSENGGSHTDFGSNVVKHENFTGDGKNYDCRGHGTHVAGTVGAIDNADYVYGVAPGVSLTGVKVLNCEGKGTVSGIIEGVNFVKGDANAKQAPVANMSLGGGASTALDDAVRDLARDTDKDNDGTIEKAVFTAVAAGNNGQYGSYYGNACNYSPARAGRTQNADGSWNKDNGVVTVAATDSSDKEASFSNYGPCVDMWAPGVSIISTYPTDTTKSASGTSMASPHVGGAGALFSKKNTTRNAALIETEIKRDLVTTANRSKDNKTYIKRLDVGYPNRY